jgi:5-(carboxyamino)imidazole ribonucleotide synthase
MEQLVTSDFKLGIIAGGQLGKMLTLAASNWDVQTYILDNDEHCPAATVCTEFVKGDRLDFDDVLRFCKKVDMVTFEMENINVGALKRIKEEGVRVHPDPEALEIIQDKGQQKAYFEKHDIPTAGFTLYRDKSEILNDLGSGKLRLPFVQKLRKGGYDGRGVAIIRSENDLDLMFTAPSVVEQLIDLEKEISVIAARNSKGEIKCFPPVEMEFNREANLVEQLICPSTLDAFLSEKAVQIAEHVIAAFDICGLLAVEMFVDRQNNIWVNEIAPRPHNSGHHTIESIITSQYEQLLRAIFNFPLGSTCIKLPSVMINLLGEPGYEGPVRYEGLTDAMGIDGVKIHLYGKKITRPFRKMGHVTVLASSVEEARQKAQMVKQKLKVTAWKNQK